MKSATIIAYRLAKTQLLEEKQKEFPLPCVVKVHSPRFQGMGIVWTYEGIADFTDSLLVLLENGNTWDYPVECCERIADELKWPKWIQEDFAERRAAR